MSPAEQRLRDLELHLRDTMGEMESQMGKLQEKMNTLGHIHGEITGIMEELGFSPDNGEEEATPE